MEEKKLYPLKFCVLQDDYAWGTEEFLLADLGYRDSLVRSGWLAGNSVGELMDTYFDRIPGERAYDFYGRQFPLTVRRLKVKGRMPLRVSPGDEIAGQRYDLLGKEKLWYVLRAGKDARIAAGFRRDCDASELLSSCEDGSVENILNLVAPYAGQSLLIPSGTPHAAFGDVEILEIGESSPLDFCLCGWGEPVSYEEFDASLNITDALDFITYTRFSTVPAAGDRLACLPQFIIDRMPLHDPVRVRCGEDNPFTLCFCLSGALSVQILGGGQTEDYPVGKGELILVPAECEDFALVPTDRDTVLVCATVNRVEPDKYINPDVEATLPEDE